MSKGPTIRPRCHLRREKPPLHHMVMQLHVHSVPTTSLKLVWGCLLTLGIFISIKHEPLCLCLCYLARIDSSSSQYGDESDVHSICTASLSDCLVSGSAAVIDEIIALIKIQFLKCMLGCCTTWEENSHTFLTVWWWRWMFAQFIL